MRQVWITSLALAAALAVLLVAGFALLGVVLTSQLLSVALIGLAIVDWLAFATLARLSARHPDLPIIALHARLKLVAAEGGTVLAALAVNYLLGFQLPRGVGFAVLVLALLLFSLVPSIFLADYYTRRWRR